MMKRRLFIQWVTSSAGTLALSGFASPKQTMAEEHIVKLPRNNEEWKKRLTPDQYDILRQAGTERPFTSPINHEKRSGLFVCVACELPLFSSQFKFDSGTGWPSFFDVLPGHVKTETDHTLGMPRTEYHCARCGGHQGHVFNDGPEPTGLRYCNNGVALRFIPEKA